MRAATATSRSIRFSEPLATSGDGAVTAIANWRLMRNADGVDVTNAITSITQSIDATTGRADVQLTLANSLAPGDYTLTAKGTITDRHGRHLDGNADGISGDDYAERFTIVAAPVPMGPKVEISTSSTSSLQSPIIAVNPRDQSYVMVWKGPGLQANESDIYARRFDAQGSPLGNAVCVNTYRLDDQADPTIAMSPYGSDYLIVWDTVGPYSTGHVTYGRRFDGDGRPMDAQQFPVNVQPSSTSTRPSAAMDYGDSGFVVAWQTDAFTGNGYEVVAQRFIEHSHGDVLATGDPIRVNSQSPAGDQWTPDVAVGGYDFLVTWNSVNGTTNEVMARWFRSDGVGTDEFRVNTTTAGIQDQPRAAKNSRGDFAVVWRSLSSGDSNIYAQRYDPQYLPINGYDPQLRPIGGEFLVNASTTGPQELPDVAIDDEGNLLVVWSDNNPSGSGYTVRWFDKWGNRLADDSRVSSVQGVTPLEATVGMAPDGEAVIAWRAANTGGGSKIVAERYTLLPPTVLDVAAGQTGNSIVVGFSQPMATTGVGSVLSTTNWALQLPDGRYIVQDDPATHDDDRLATPEQFGAISLAFNTSRQRWEATIPLNFTLQHGTYQLTARGSLCNASGRRLDGNADGTAGGDFAADLLIEVVAPSVTVDSLTTNSPSPALHGTVDDPRAAVQVTVAGHTYAAANDASGHWTLAENSLRSSLLHGVYDVTVAATDTVGNVGASSAAVVIDRAVPTVTIRRATGQSSPVRFAAVFSEVVYDFTSSDATVSGTVGPTTVEVTNPSGDHVNFEVAVSGMTDIGTVGVTIESGQVHDVAGNANVTQVSNVNEATWHNLANPFDVNGDDGVNPLDVLIVINWINVHSGDGSLPVPPVAPPIYYYDVSNDGLCTPVDVLLVINHINTDPGVVGAEGENVARAWAVNELDASCWMDRLPAETQGLPTSPLARSPQPARAELREWAGVAAIMPRDRCAAHSSRRSDVDQSHELDEVLSPVDDILPDIATDIQAAWAR